MLTLQILPDNTGNDAYSNTTIFIQAGHSEADIILFPRHPEIQTGMGDGINTVGKTDIYDSLKRFPFSGEGGQPDPSVHAGQW